MKKHTILVLFLAVAALVLVGTKVFAKTGRQTGNTNPSHSGRMNPRILRERMMLDSFPPCPGNQRRPFCRQRTENVDRTDIKPETEMRSLTEIQNPQLEPQNAQPEEQNSKTENQEQTTSPEPAQPENTQSETQDTKFDMENQQSAQNPQIETQQPEMQTSTPDTSSLTQ